MINKQKLTELLRKKEYWERKRNEYCRQYLKRKTKINYGIVPGNS